MRINRPKSLLTIQKMKRRRQAEAEAEVKIKTQHNNADLSKNKTRILKPVRKRKHYALQSYLINRIVSVDI